MYVCPLDPLRLDVAVPLFTTNCLLAKWMHTTSSPAHVCDNLAYPTSETLHSMHTAGSSGLPHLLKTSLEHAPRRTVHCNSQHTYPAHTSSRRHSYTHPAHKQSPAPRRLPAKNTRPNQQAHPAVWHSLMCSVVSSQVFCALHFDCRPCCWSAHGGQGNTRCAPLSRDSSQN